ncbi:hypothetical protein BHE74_00024833 [Ensete ventricosum]|nr:hypothetical protein BHE74_00024833 [Ensete ventricosum]
MEEWWRGWSDTSAGRAEHNDGQIEAVADKNQKSVATRRDRGHRGFSCRVRSTGGWSPEDSTGSTGGRRSWPEIRLGDRKQSFNKQQSDVASEAESNSIGQVLATIDNCYSCLGCKGRSKQMVFFVCQHYRAESGDEKFNGAGCDLPKSRAQPAKIGSAEEEANIVQVGDAIVRYKAETKEPLYLGPGCLVLGPNPRPEGVAAPRHEATTLRGRSNRCSAGSKVVAHVGKEPYLVWKQRAEMKQGKMLIEEATVQVGNGGRPKRMYIARIHEAIWSQGVEPHVPAYECSA